MNTLVLDNLSVHYGTYRALWDVNLAVKEGDFVTVMGPNGSGKSTLLKTILGLVPAFGGTIKILGGTLKEAQPGSIAYVPQIKTMDRTFPARALELVLNGLHGRWPGRVRPDDKARALKALGQVGAAHLADRSLSGLSGGEMQRLYLARGMVREPRLILLDEPATGIDVVGTAGLYDLLDAYRKTHPVTILLVTHDWEVAFHHASQALLLNRRQISFGPPAEALSEDFLRLAFGHVGHAHAMKIGG